MFTHAESTRERGGIANGTTASVWDAMTRCELNAGVCRQLSHQGGRANWGGSHTPLAYETTTTWLERCALANVSSLSNPAWRRARKGSRRMSMHLLSFRLMHPESLRARHDTHTHFSRQLFASRDDHSSMCSRRGRITGNDVNLTLTAMRYTHHSNVRSAPLPPQSTHQHKMIKTPQHEQ